MTKNNPSEIARQTPLWYKPELMSQQNPPQGDDRSGKRDGLGSKKPKLPGLNGKNGVWTWILFGLAVLFFVSVYARPDFASKEVPYSDFMQKLEAGDIKKVVLSAGIIKGFTEEMTEQRQVGQPPPTVYLSIRVQGDETELFKIMREKKIRFEEENVALKNLLWHWILPFVALLFVWRVLFSRAFRMGPGAGIMSFGKNRARLVVDDSKKVTFEDVAGVEEAKEELSEIIEFLKTPQKFRAIGGKIPKGILLVGPPGTGKTLLARAVAGEAGVPFFSLSGSEFVEMFVGVGAARVRDLFAQAVEKSPCIIFIDELDAIGKVRSAVSPMGGHDEREQTLNQLLVEMDGFDTRTGVIIMAATNRPETLDPALLRAGRFDRQVLVDRPDVNGREAILKIHCRNVKTKDTVDLRVVAARTPGFVGADLANVVNEAALLAVRKGKNEVELSDFDDAIDRVIAGLQKKTRLINQKEKLIVAHHEVGHALATYFTPGTDPVHKISVIPRGFGALGYTMSLPKEDRYLMTREELRARIDVLFGGRVSEEVMFNEISTGASDDIQKATDIAKRMIMEYAMSDRLATRTFAGERSQFLQGAAGPSGKEYSDATAELLDNEIQRVLTESYARVKKLITSKKELLAKIAKILSEREVLESKEFEEIIRNHENGTDTSVTPPPSLTEVEPERPGVDFAPPPPPSGDNGNLPKPGELV